MPYITQQDRQALRDQARLPESAGELNYAITTAVLAWIERQGKSYATFNAAIGALECAKLELYRRMVGPYEDTKIAANGDVYP